MDNHDVIYMEPRCHGCSYEAKGGAGLIWCEEDVWTKCEECGEKPAKYFRATPAREAAEELLVELVNCSQSLNAARMIMTVKISRDMAGEIVAAAERAIAKAKA